MSYYHILIEVNDHISTIEETRDIEIFDIVEIQPYLHSILLPYFNEQLLELEDENLEFKTRNGYRVTPMSPYRL